MHQPLFAKGARAPPPKAGDGPWTDADQRREKRCVTTQITAAEETGIVELMQMNI